MSTNMIICIAGFLPSILLGFYVWWKDSQKEPLYLLTRGFYWGCMIIGPVILVEDFICSFFDEQFLSSTIFGVVINAFVVAATPEECFKFLVFWLLVRNNPYFDEHYDGIVYAVSVSLGFATLENIVYLYGADDWITTAVLRSLLAVPGHYAFAVFMGYYYSLYRFVERSVKNAIFVILVPVLVHGLYDTIALGNPYLGSILFIVLVVFCINIHRKANERLMTLIEKDKQS